jgi:hypothetical protein
MEDGIQLAGKANYAILGAWIPAIPAGMTPFFLLAESSC